MLESIRAKGALVTARLQAATFQSLVRRVDLAAKQLVLERSPSEEANALLLGQARCTFRCGIPGFRVEFVAAGAKSALDGDRSVIVVELPEVLVTHQQRAHPRAEVTPSAPLRCVADEGGITPFDARVIDVGQGGLAFLLYPAEIQLEPGTVLRGCRIELPDGRPCVTDLEVRYTQPVVLADGSRAARSGCRFLNPGPEVGDLVKRYVKS